MSDDQQPADDERVGYRRPPKYRQFKPGSRANPAGRGGRKRNDLAEAVQKTLMSKVLVREGAKKRTVTKSEANVASLIDNVKRGDAAAADRLLDLFESASSGGTIAPRQSKSSTACSIPRESIWIA